MGEMMQVMTLLLLIGGGYYLYSNGYLDQLLKAPAAVAPTPAPVATPAPAPSRGGGGGGRRGGGGGGEEAAPEPEAAPAPTGGGGVVSQGTSCPGGETCKKDDQGRYDCDGPKGDSYEATWCGTFSGDDLTIKMYGPQHSSDGDCCWCVMHVKEDGTMVPGGEGPHPSSNCEKGGGKGAGKAPCYKGVMKPGPIQEGWALIGGKWQLMASHKGPCGCSKTSTTKTGDQVTFRCDGNFNTTCATVKPLGGAGAPEAPATSAKVAKAYSYQAGHTDPIGDFLKAAFSFLDSIFKPKQQLAPLAPAPSVVQPAPPRGGTQTVVGPTTGGPSSVTGTNVYKVVGNIATAGTGVTVRGGGNSFRDNIGYPCSKCARESTWIFKPGTGGDWSLKLGSHGDEGGKETLIELGNVSPSSGGGKWRCEGPHMTYNDVSGGSGGAPAIAGRARVGAKAVTWPLGGNRIHHEIYMDLTGAGNRWQKVAQFDGAATGCNAITCPVPGSKCQDTLRMDGPKGHQFFSRSCVEIVPGAGAVGGGGALPPTAAAPTIIKQQKPKQPTSSTDTDRLPSGKPRGIEPATPSAAGKAVLMSPPTTSNYAYANSFNTRISWLPKRRIKYYDTRPGGSHRAPLLPQTATGVPTSYYTLEQKAMGIVEPTDKSYQTVAIAKDNTLPPLDSMYAPMK